MRIETFNAVIPDVEIITSPSSFISDAKSNFQAYFENGYFEELKTPGFFVHKIVSPLGEFYGLVADVEIKEFIQRKILPHEKTLKRKEQVSMQLLIKREAMIKPVLLTYPSQKKIETFLRNFTQNNEASLEVYFEDKNEQHSYYQIQSTKDIKKVSLWFEDKIAKAYVADGHHRIAVYQNFHKKKKGSKLDVSHILCSFFSFDNLKILDYNRVVTLNHNMSPINLLARLSSLGNIYPLAKGSKPIRKHQMSVNIEDEWFAFEWKTDLLLNYSRNGVVLDHDILNDLVFHNIMHIEDVLASEQIEYITGVTTVEEIEAEIQEQKHKVAFLLFPVQMEELEKISDRNSTLPPKSTYFVPRLYNALLCKNIAVTETH